MTVGRSIHHLPLRRTRKLKTHCESIVTDEGQKSFYGLMSTIKTNYLLADIR